MAGCAPPGGLACGAGLSRQPVAATLLFDTAMIPAGERFAAAQDLLMHNSHSMTIDPAGTADPAAFRFQAWAMAPDAVMFAASGPGLHMHGRDHDEQALFSLTTQSTGQAWVVQNGVGATLTPGSLRLVDLDAAYDYSWSGMGSSVSYQLTLDAVGLQRAEIAAAALRLSASPLCGIVRDHLTDLVAQAHAGKHVYHELHQAMVDLARELVISVLPDDPPRYLPVSDTVLWAELCSHIRRHVHEPTLDEASVAESLGVERERLCRIARTHGAELNDLISTRRVQGARAELTRRSPRIIPGRAALSSAAARWGFTSAEALLEAMTESGEAPSGHASP